MIKLNQSTTPEATDNATGFTPFFKDFYYASNTIFGDFLAESADLFRARPDLVDRIEADLDRHGLEKKKLREADRLFLANRTRELKGFENLVDLFPGEDAGGKAECPPSKLDFLEQGRTRLPGAVVGVLMLARGYHGSCTNKEALDFLAESKSLEAFLAMHELTLPGRSTMSELINAISLETREAILSAQLSRATQEGLDDFEQALIDSTAAKANSCWPTDAKTIFVLAQRLFQLGRTFHLYGLANILPGRMQTYLEDLSNKPFQINLNAKKKKKFRKFCQEFIETATKFLYQADQEYQRLIQDWNAQLDGGKILPTRREQARTRVNLFAETLHLASKSLKQMHERIFEDKTFPSTERVLSLHDRSAAYIAKGGRQPVIGYKPQLARSANGYVTALKVDEGNTSDSANLVPMVKQAIANTGVTPYLVSVDDGYSSKAGHDQVKELGVSIVSISGSKGKKITGEAWNEDEYRQARAGRSAVESLMFCLKYGFDFGQLSRTGLAAARDEFLEKCLAYNICRTILLRKRKRQQQTA